MLSCVPKNGTTTSPFPQIVVDVLVVSHANASFCALRTPLHAPGERQAQDEGT